MCEAALPLPLPSVDVEGAQAASDRRIAERREPGRRITTPAEELPRSTSRGLVPVSRTDLTEPPLADGVHIERGLREDGREPVVPVRGGDENRLGQAVAHRWEVHRRAKDKAAEHPLDAVGIALGPASRLEPGCGQECSAGDVRESVMASADQAGRCKREAAASPGCKIVRPPHTSKRQERSVRISGSTICRVVLAAGIASVIQLQEACRPIASQP